MNHLALLLICILSVEVFIRFNFLLLLDSILKVAKKVTYIIPNENISDHWKEKAIPAYALKIMKFSGQIFLIISCIFSFFFIPDIFLSGFLIYTLSFIGIFESMVFAFGYVFFRKSVIK